MGIDFWWLVGDVWCGILLVFVIGIFGIVFYLVGWVLGFGLMVDVVGFSLYWWIVLILFLLVLCVGL